MRIVTWNINSVRARIDRVVAFLQRFDVDVLALQETKCKPEQFPTGPLEEAGYEVAAHGLDQWNGVAIISRVGIDDVEMTIPGLPLFGDPEKLEARALGANCGGVSVWSLYVPNGREIDHPHYRYKLAWLEAVRADGARRLAENPAVTLAYVGDFNVVPEDDDVWSMEAFEGSTHVTQPERDAFTAIIDAGFTDVVRPFTPGPGVYTFWDYQQLRFPKKQGMRIDFVLGSEAFAKRVTAAEIARDERKGKGASDHAPVVVDLAD